MKRIPIPATLIATAALFLAVTAQAAEFCVRTSDELKDALDEAANNGEADTIRIATGHYPVPSDGGFWYDARQEGDDDFDLTISGGWTEGFDNFPCGLLLNPNPLTTNLDGGDEKRVMRIDIRDNASVTVRGLTFRNGQAFNEAGGGLLISVFHDEEGGYTGNIRIERNIFLNNESHLGGGLTVAKSTGIAYTAIGDSRLGVVNNVFIGNNARSHIGAAQLSQDGEDDGPFGVGIYVTNNTVLSNTQETDSGNAYGGFTVAGNTPNVYVINNNMWGNDGVDLSVLGGGPLRGANRVFRLMNNNIGIRTSVLPTHDFGNISVEPEYIPCPGICVPFVLPVPTMDSPLVNAGIHPGNIPPFWTMPTLDAAGKPRVAEGTVDIGAYENHNRVFSDRFE